MFVTTLEMDNFDCTKMNACFQKFTACLREGLIHEWKQALLAPLLPLMLLNNSWLCSSLVPRLSPRANEKSKERGEPGRIYHVRNVIGRENLITCVAIASWPTEWD